MAVASAVEFGGVLRLPYSPAGIQADASTSFAKLASELGVRSDGYPQSATISCACVLGAHAFELKQTGGEQSSTKGTMNRSSSAIDVRRCMS